MRRIIPFAALVSLVLVAAPAGADVSPSPVRASRLDERFPAASADFIAWQQNSKAHPRHYNLYVKPAGEASFRVNAAGTEANTGAIDGTTLVYQEYQYRQGVSDLKLFDLSTETSSDPPATVNTDDWEYWPSLSGDWLLFGREAGGVDDSIVLFNLSTQESQTLAESSGIKRDLEPGQVNGNFAVWDKVVYRRGAVVSCEVFVYDIAAGTTTQIPNPRQRCQYAPSVTAAGTVYLARSRMGCGLSVTLRSYPPGGPATTLLSLPSGMDLYSSYAFTQADETTSLFYDPSPCTGGNADIYEVTIP